MPRRYDEHSLDAERGRLKITITRPKTSEEQSALAALSPDERLVILVMAGTRKMQVLAEHPIASLLPAHLST